LVVRHKYTKKKNAISQAKRDFQQVIVDVRKMRSEGLLMGNDVQMANVQMCKLFFATATQRHIFFSVSLCRCGIFLCGGIARKKCF